MKENAIASRASTHAPSLRFHSFHTFCEGRHIKKKNVISRQYGKQVSGYGQISPTVVQVDECNIRFRIEPSNWKNLSLFCSLLHVTVGTIKNASSKWLRK